MDGNQQSYPALGQAASSSQGQATTNVSTTGSAFVSGGAGPALPAVSVPSGGGTLRTMEEAFDLELVTGTASLRYGVPVTKIARWGTPALQLAYSSGGGLTSYGMGWALAGLGSISRSTRLGLPTYIEEQDVFEYDGEELVPVFAKVDGRVEKTSTGAHQLVESIRDGYFVRQYKRRIDNQYDHIERWTNQTDCNDVHWRVQPGNGTTLLFGCDGSARTAFGDKIFAWHYCQGYDGYGNAQLVLYKVEDSANVDLVAANETNRTKETRRTMVYPKRVFYGNTTPNRTDDWDVILPEKLNRSSWMFELVLDYGDHDKDIPQPNDDAISAWPARQDPNSSYQAGFEVRNYRLCRRFLMYHHLPEELMRANYLVSVFELEFAEDQNVSYLTSLGFVGYKTRQGEGYISKRLPRTEFNYSRPLDQNELLEMFPQSFDKDSLPSLPSGTLEQLKWMDLYGDGTTGILARNSDCWYYKRNLSNAMPNLDGSFDITVRFGEAEEIPTRPLQGSTSDSIKATFQDLDGDGSIDLITDSTNGTHGFFQGSKQVGNASATWSSFRSFPQWPNLDTENPNMRQIDLSGRGRADLLITTDDVFVWHQSLGREGYGPEQQVSLALNEEHGPRVLFADVTESIHLADLSGDGMVDIVRIRNGQVCYWPNLGHGRFGSKVIMDHAPRFDSDDSFTAQRLLLGDVDGSGTTDLLYFGSSGATLYYNQAGNSWSEPLKLPGLVPNFDSRTQVCAVNLLGSGMCLVWQSLGAGSVLDSLKYIDMTHGVKPHLLTSFVNNKGLETTLTYQTSTSYYLRDELEGRRWLTTTPMPVHCVDKIVKHDHISRTRLSQRIRYHHGYYDGKERSFCGFGMVEKWDTEEFDVLSDSVRGKNATNVSPATFTGPVHTKTWFHVGALKDVNALRKGYEREFYNDAKLDIRKTPHVLVHDVSDKFKCLVADHAYTDEELRQATYALRGVTIREERYCDQTSPYMVSQYGNTVSLVQPKGENAFMSCSLYQSELFQSTFDKNVTDGRTSQQLKLLVDAYGNTLKSVTINYERDFVQHSDLEEQDHQIQARTHIIYDEAGFTNAIATLDAYRVPIQYSSQSFELVGLKASRGKAYNYEDFAGNGDFSNIQQLSDLEYFQDGVDFATFGGVKSQAPTEGKRLLSSARRFFCSDDQTKRLPEGSIEALAVVDQEYALCMSSKMLSAYMQNDKSILPSNTVLSELGYIDLYGDKSCWLPSSKLLFGRNDEDELVAARRSFFQSGRSVDALGNATTVEYDQYQLLPISSSDAYGNQTSLTIDYRTLSTASSTDINGNRIDYAYDAANTLVGIAIVAKGDAETNGLQRFNPDISQEDLQTFFSSPLDQAVKALGTATHCYLYDANQYVDHRMPAYTISIQRETFGATDSDIQMVISFIDGSGRTIQIKSKAEESRWRVSGWQVFNNKGLPVEVYDPLFSSKHTYEIDGKSDHCQLIFYDTRSREIARLFPDHTWTKIEYSNWCTTTFGRNNLVDKSPANDLDIGAAVKCLSTEAYQPTWQEKCRTGTAEEKRALEKALIHKDKSSRMYSDPQGKAVLRVVELDSGLTRQRSYFNIEGRSVVDKDTMQRVGQQTIHDMLGRVMVSATIDKGWKWTLIDAVGNEAYSWTSTGRFRQEYDKLNRPLRNYYNGLGRTEICVSKFEYGEDIDLDLAKAKNLRGRLFKVYDQSGKRTNQEFDIFGNCIRSDQELAKEYKLDVDWSTEVQLEPDTYTTTSTFDALGRVVLKQAPDKAQTRYQYNAGGLLCRVEGKLEDSDDWKPYKFAIIYDELARIISETSNNGVACTWTYDTASRKLVAKTIKSETAQLQNVKYVYDASGNLVFEIDKQQKTVYFRNARVTAGSEYTYDNLNRLVKATGREHIGQTQGKPFSSSLSTSSPVTGQTAAGGDGSALARYTESYEFDACGNISQIRHAIDDAQSPGWTRRLLYQEQSKIEPHMTGNALSSSTVGGITERFTYDEHGNTLSMANVSKATWDPFDRLKSTVSQVMKSGTPETTYYVYDVTGSRMRKIVERASTHSDSAAMSSQTYYLDQTDHVLKYHGTGDVSLECWTSKVTGEDKVYVLIERWSGSLQSSKGLPSLLTRYQCHNLSKSVFTELDDNANVVSYEEYTPYGSTSCRMNIYSAPKRYRFAGKERDHETGFYYNEQRYYLPWICRWLNPDPAGTIDGLNLYAFVQGNPVTLTDSSGTMTNEEEEAQNAENPDNDALPLQLGQEPIQDNGAQPDEYDDVEWQDGDVEWGEDGFAVDSQPLMVEDAQLPAVEDEPVIERLIPSLLSFVANEMSLRNLLNPKDPKLPEGLYGKAIESLSDMLQHIEGEITRLDNKYNRLKNEDPGSYYEALHKLTNKRQDILSRIPLGDGGTGSFVITLQPPPAEEGQPIEEEEPIEDVNNNSRKRPRLE